jgi:hypothetical protein
MQDNIKPMASSMHFNINTWKHPRMATSMQDKINAEHHQHLATSTHFNCHA